MPPLTARRGLDSRKTKDELIAELEELRIQVSADSTDPTSQLELDEWFQDGERQLRLLIDALPVQISYVDAHLRYRYVNHAYEDWFGHSRDWVIGRHVGEVLGEAAYEALRGYLERTLAGEVVTYEDTIPFQSGGTRYIHASYIPHFNEDGTVSGFFVTATDISERKKAEETLREANGGLESRVEERTRELRRANEELKNQIAARERTEAELRESENLLKRIIDEIPAPLAVKDVQGRYVKINKGWRNLFNTEEKDSLGKTAEQISSFTPEQGKKISQDDRAVIEGKKIVTQLVRHVQDRNGVERIFDARKVPLKDEKGNSIGLISIGLDITESWKAELAKNESEEKLRAVFDHSPSAIILKDLGGRYLHVNRRFEEWHGVSSEEVIGKTVYDLLPTEYADPIAEQEQKVLETGKTDIREIEMPTLDHSDLSIINTKFPVRNADGRIIGIGTISTDLTERKLAEKALSSSEAQFQELVEGSIQGILIHRNRKAIFANQACADIFGYENSNDILRLDDVFDLVAPEERDRLFSNYKNRMDGKAAPSHYDFKGLKKDGTMVRIDNIARRVSWKGEPAIQTTYFDITKRKLAEEKLRESEELFRSIVDNSPSGICLKDLEGRYQMVNRRYEAWVGKSAGEILGKTSSDLFPAKYSERFIDQDREVLESGGPVEWEYKAPLGEGSGHHFNTKFPVYNAAGELFAVGAFFTDISERRKAEEELRSSQRLLQTVFDTIPVEILVKDLSGRYLMVNDKMASFYGQSPHEITGKKFENLGAGTDKQRSQVAEDDHRVFESGETLIFSEAPCLLPGGETIWRRGIKAPLRDSTGDVVGIVGVMEDITEHRQAEEALRSNQRLLKTVFDTIPHNLFVKDINSNYLMTNRANTEGYGLKPEDLKGLHTLDIPFGTPGERQRFLEFDRKVLESGQRLENHDYPITQPDGTVRYFSNIILPLQGPEGEMAGLVGVAEDITERKLAAEKLRESEELFRNTVENSPIIFFLKDMEGRFLLVNRQYEKWEGKRREEMIGKNSSEIFPEEFSHLFDFQDREVSETGRPVSREIDVPNANGMRRIVCTKFPVRNTEGLPIAIGSIISDITARRQAEGELRQSRDQLRTITDNLPVLILYVDKDERYLFMNKSADRWLEKSSETLLGKTVREVLGESEYEKIQPYIKQALSGQEVRFEPHLNYPDGRERILDLLFIPDVEKSGAVKGYFALGRDITEFKSLEEKLRQSQKMEALGTLTGGIAHDFNNILAPILGFSEILLGKADPSTKEYKNLNSIFKSAIRAKDLVSQIMLFSRRSESKKVNNDLRTVLREIVGLLHSTFPKSISVQANISRNPGIVYCDPSQIYQVLLNLCVNAEQALNENGEITISMDRAELEEFPDFTGNLLSGNFVRLTVSDNGVGMEADILPHIFDPFFTKREVGEGTGLGLSTVFGIVKAHDGGIAVTSEPGQGATFEIFLPRVEDSPEPFAGSSSAVPTGDETILFVDDEEEIVILAKEILEDKGYRVMAFSDPIEALDAFKAGPDSIDLVLTDQSMPKMKGEWLVRDIRKINPDIPIILCTGYSRTISPERGKAIGINHFLNKPISPNDLCRVVREVLDSAR